MTPSESTPGSQDRLRREVNRFLAVRIAGASLLAAAAVAALTWAVMKDEVGNAVLAFASEQAELFSRTTASELIARGGASEAEVQQALEEFMEVQPRGRRLGDSVAIDLVRLDGERRASWRDPDYVLATEAGEILEAESLQLPVFAPPRLLRVDGHPLLLLEVAVRDQQGSARGAARVLFAISDEVRSAAWRRLWRAVAAAAGVALLTALVLYPLVASLVARLARASAQLLEANLQTLEALGSAIAKRDADTEGHSYRVTLTSVWLAEALGWSQAEIRELIKGALLHDVGKIGIADAILLKPGKLTDEEYEVMKQHVRHGVEIVDRSAWLATSRDVVGFHHERFDGSGYPARVPGDAIPEAARIFAIADVFDALISRRPYKEPVPLDGTLSILRGLRGTHLDPEVVDVFTEMAPAIYDRLVDRDTADLKSEYHQVVSRYFDVGLEVLEGPAG